MGFGQGTSTRSNPLRHETVTARRQVYPTSEIPHKWAHRTQEAARNAQGNLYFKGTTIYSYRDSWPLARIYAKPGFRKGANRLVSAQLVLTNSERYGTTTAQHQDSVNRAVSHLPAIAVPEVCVSGVDGWYGPTEIAHRHGKNLAHLIDLAAEHLKKAQRAMSTAQVNWRHRSARQAIDDAAAYMSFFGIRRKAPVFPMAEWDAALARVQRIENPDPLSADKRERSSAARKARMAERDEYLSEQRAALERGAFYRNSAFRTDWRLFGAFGTQSNYYPHNRGEVMLRYAPDIPFGNHQIETSMGARIPAAQAAPLWALIEGCRANGGREFKGHIKAGDYPLTRIDVDGTLVVGCHKIPYGELRGIARQLGLA